MMIGGWRRVVSIFRTCLVDDHSATWSLSPAAYSLIHARDAATGCEIKNDPFMWESLSTVGGQGVRRWLASEAVQAALRSTLRSVLPDWAQGRISVEDFRRLLRPLSGPHAGQAGVDQRLLLSSPRQTTLSVAVTRPDGEAQYSFYGHESADRSLLPSELPATLPDDVSAIAIGSYTLAIDPTASAIEQLIEREHVRRVVSIDPNIRPTIIGDAKAWRPRFERLLARCHIVKASTEDLAYLYGDGVDAGAWAAHWLTAGPQLVIITRGDDGASVFFGSSTYNVPVRKVDVIDTVGAGDSFHAAVLVSLEEQNLLRPGAIRLASRDALIRAIHFAS